MTSRNIPPLSSHPQGRRGTLLIVDDESGPREALVALFRDQYDILTASSGREAIALASANTVDVAICDLRMPGMNGTEVLRELKQMDPSIEVIMLTAHESVETARVAMSCGAAEYFGKPFELPTFREAVNRCFERRRMAVARDERLEQLESENRKLETGSLRRERKPEMQMPSRSALQNKEEEDFVHWRDYWQILFERKWIAITTLVVVVTFAVIWNFKATPIYKATTRLQADAEDVKVLNIQDVVSTDIRDVQYLNTQLRILQSRTLAGQVAESLHLAQNKQFLPGAKSGVDHVTALQRSLNVQLVQDTRLIDISVVHPDPEMAALLANGVAREFLKQNLERKLSASLEAVRWLKQQADEYRSRVEKSEMALQDYREKTHAVSLEDRQNIVIQKLQELNSAVTKAKTERLAAEIQWNEVKAALDAGQNPVQIPEIAANSLVSTLRQQLAVKQIAISTLRERYKEKHPEMIAATAELKEIEERLRKACDETAESLKSGYLMFKTKEEGLVQALREQEQEALDLNRKLIDYVALKRNAEGDQQLYDSILARMKEAGVAGKLDINNIRILDPALKPLEPYKPMKARNILLFAILGVLFGIGFSFAANFYDDKIKTDDAVESYLGLPLLSCVPAIKHPTIPEKARVSHLDPHSISSEAFRSLRASLILSAAAKGKKCILVTSAAPGEGKSLVASNLAIVYAHNNQRTLLIDADMRHPMQQKIFEIGSKSGLSTFLSNGTMLSDIICKTDVPNLDVVAVGNIPPWPAELLNSSRMPELLREAAKHYDQIIVDSPPVTAVSDPLILLQYVEAVVFVVHFRKVRRNIVWRSVQKIREGGVPVLGAVLNNVNIERHGYYYYPYGSYYHYSRKESDETPRGDKSRGVGVEV